MTEVTLKLNHTQASLASQIVRSSAELPNPASQESKQTQPWRTKLQRVLALLENPAARKKLLLSKPSIKSITGSSRRLSRGASTNTQVFRKGKALSSGKVPTYWQKCIPVRRLYRLSPASEKKGASGVLLKGEGGLQSPPAEPARPWASPLLTRESPTSLIQPSLSGSYRLRVRYQPCRKQKLLPRIIKKSISGWDDDESPR